MKEKETNRNTITIIVSVEVYKNKNYCNREDGFWGECCDFLTEDYNYCNLFQKRLQINKNYQIEKCAECKNKVVDQPAESDIEYARRFL